jgi:hypothetical protein
MIGKISIATNRINRLNEIQDVRSQESRNDNFQLTQIKLIEKSCFALFYLDS